MTAKKLREKQAPIKQLYREQPDKALITLRAEAIFSEGDHGNAVK